MQLNIQTQQIAQGNFNIESLPITSPKELKELNISFTMMIAKIQAQMADIQLELIGKLSILKLPCAICCVWMFNCSIF